MPARQRARLDAVLKSDLPPSTRLVYVCINAHSNWETFEAYVKRETICAETGLGKSTVSAALTELHDKGWITSRKIGAYKVVYTVATPNADVERVDEDAEPVKGLPRATKGRARKRADASSYEGADGQNPDGQIPDGRNPDGKRPESGRSPARIRTVDGQNPDVQRNRVTSTGLLEQGYSNGVTASASDDDGLFALEVFRHEPSAITFDTFWAVYPRKAGKPKAKEAWQKAVKRAEASAIVAGAERYRDDPNREPAYTAHPSTWLNGDRWEDEALPERHAAGIGPGSAGRHNSTQVGKHMGALQAMWAEVGGNE